MEHKLFTVAASAGKHFVSRALRSKSFYQLESLMELLKKQSVKEKEKKSNIQSHKSFPFNFAGQ